MDPTEVTVVFVSGFLLGGSTLWILKQGDSSFLRWRQRKRAEGHLIAILEGLPDEMKSLMVQYQLQGCHTRRLNPTDPQVQFLINAGVLVHGGSCSSYDGVDGFIRVREPYWAVLPRWARKDPRFAILADALLEQEDPGVPDAGEG